MVGGFLTDLKGGMIPGHTLAVVFRQHQDSLVGPDHFAERGPGGLHRAPVHQVHKAAFFEGAGDRGRGDGVLENDDDDFAGIEN